MRLHLDEETVERLEDISKATDCSKSHLIREAISLYLAEYTDYHIALDRLHDSSDDVVSSREMRNLLVND
jgi:predicted DNA-binding protein